MANTIIIAITIFAGFPKRNSNRLGIEVTPCFAPTSYILPAYAEKRNIPAIYGKAVIRHSIPLVYPRPARPIMELPPMIVAHTVASMTFVPKV